MVCFSRRTALSGSAALALGFSSRQLAFANQNAETPVAAPQLPVTVTDAAGNEVTVEDISRIVPLSGDIAEIIWGLGLGANIAVSYTHLTLPTIYSV